MEKLESPVIGYSENPVFELHPPPSAVASPKIGGGAKWLILDE